MIFALILMIGGSLIALTNWRRGIYAVVLAGFLQDPIRKLVPGEPVYLSLIAAALFGVCFLSAVLSGEKLGLKDLHRFNSAMYLPSTLFVIWVCIAVLNAYANTHNLVLAGIGALAYLAPIPGLMLGYRFARNPDEVLKLLIFYMSIAVVFGVSLYLETAGLDWSILGSVGEGFVFYPESGGVTVLRSGLFRSPELAGWHCATAVCFLVILGLARPLDWKFFGMVGLIAAVIVPALVLTGRRKFIMEIVMFLGFAYALITYFKSGSRRLATVYTIAALISAAFFFYITSSELPGEWSVYVDRSSTVAADSKERFLLMTGGMLFYVIDRNGFFGLGAGTGSQGAQHFGGGSVLVGTAAEGGLGKILAELGVPGLLLLVWILISIGRYIYAAARHIKPDESVAPLAYGIIAFLLANVVVFTTAHQIFGDVNILLTLGLLLGILLRTPYLLRAQPTPARPALKRRMGRRFVERDHGAG